MKSTVMVVEDEQAISDLICMNLQVAGYLTVTAFDGIEAERVLMGREMPDLALVDIMLPGKDGFELMETFQEHGIPVIYLTAKADVMSKVQGLRLGAEDYIVKPFEILELLVRVEKVLERTGRQRQTIILGDLTIETSSHKVYLDGAGINLKPMEYDLLIFLAANKNVALSREQLLNHVWGSDYLGETRTVDVHIGQLRKKLNLDHAIRTIPKYGYRLEDCQ